MSVSADINNETCDTTSSDSPYLALGLDGRSFKFHAPPTPDIEYFDDVILNFEISSTKLNCFNC